MTALYPTPTVPATPAAAPTATSDQVVAHLEELLTAEEERWSRLGADLAEPAALLRRYVLAGGKRLRPQFCRWGFLGAGGHPSHPAVLDAGAALELLHAFALVHDDVMDGSATRRGRPALHEALAHRHAARAWRGEARRFGEAVAILVGDLAITYADRLLAGAPPAALAVWHELKVELVVGQHLDLLAAARGDRCVDRSRLIARYKSGRYTVERPLHLGAALAGWYAELAPHYSAYGAPLGEAFQLRDDLLGAFGDPEATGKPVGDDLREGKPTVLLALAHERVRGASAALLERVGRPDLSGAEIARIQELLLGCGAAAAVEAMIDARVDEALQALERAPIHERARAGLRDLAAGAAWRDR